MTPPESNETGEPTEQTFAAGDLLRLIGLTYRQLNDWESRAGIFGQVRTNSEGWRKFTYEQVLALAVCAALRRQFSLPLEKVGKLYWWLMNASDDKREAFFAKQGRETAANMERGNEDLLNKIGQAKKVEQLDDVSRFYLLQYVRAKLESHREFPILYAFLSAKIAGEHVFLYTDFEVPMILFEQNLANAIGMRLLTKPTVICPLNAIFDELRKEMGDPPLEGDKMTPLLVEKWKKLESRVQITADEQEILRLLRSKQYQRVTVHLNSGRMLRADCEEELPKMEASKRDALILETIAEGSFATVTIQKKNGEIFRLSRTETLKFSARPQDAPDP